MKALILAAGYATRLYPLTRDFPKPLLPVDGRPIIDYGIEKLSRVKSIDEIFVVTNSKFIGLFRKWKQSLACGKKITLVDDLTKTKDDRRGAIGDMYFVIASKRIGDDFLVLGGDNIFDSGLDAFLSFAREHAPYPALGIYDVGNKLRARNYGVIKLDREKRIVDFKEKPLNPASTLAAMCLYYFPKGKIGLVKKYMEERKGQYDAIGLYIDWLRKKESVYGFVFSGKWYDIGQHKVFEEAKKKFK